MPEITQKQIDFKESQHPAILVILDYWKDKRGSRFAPAWSEIELMDLPLSLIPHLVVVDVVGSQMDFRYRFWGTWHVQFHGYDQTNKLVSELKPPPYSELLSNQYKQTIEVREPQLFVQRIPIKSGFWVYTELSRFPLSDDGETVTNILSAELAFGDTSEVREYFSGNE